MYSENPDVFDSLTGQNATAEVMDRMRLFGATPPADEVDPRPLPDSDQSLLALDVIFETISELFADSCLEGESGDVLWSVVNMFQHKYERLSKGFDQLGYEMRRALREQDGSEIRSVELEKLQIRAHATESACVWFEGLRDRAADAYAVATGKPWMPARGSRSGRNRMTSAVIDSRDFLAANERAKTMALIPEGPKVVITGGMDYHDHKTVWAALDKVHRRHDTLVLVHGGAPRGTDMIAAKWATARNVAQIVFKPDWKRHGKSRAGFIRNDRMLALPPIGVLAFPGTGVTDNLYDKARTLGIPARKFA